ncbi:MAG: translation elongation factor Ts [Actinobacteria bacterium]|nr:MAG: translation elongation factor Ts [Actinomycetota bacterium]
MSEPLSIPADVVKRLRDETGAGMMDCKRALVETGGDLERARDLLRTRGQASAKKRAGRQASEGLVDAYIHGEGRIGVMVEVNSETDFVARTDEFRRLARELAMQIAATDPRWISRDDVPADVIEGERKIYEEQARATGKPDNVISRIVDGKLETFFKEFVLLDQPYIRDDSKKVNDLVTEFASKVGENVVVRRFVRFRLGEEGT